MDIKKDTWLRESKGWELIDAKNTKKLHRENKTLFWFEGKEYVFQHITKKFTVQAPKEEATTKYHEMMVRFDAYPVD